ncbi:MAG: SDR family oxidoreductase [Nitrospirae bacterium]|nr:SDR family oxidoreductase [Candidatus Manganitrophaceae bacterium]
MLVTGGAGFLGSHLCEALLGQGHEVLSLDNYFTGSKENIAPFLQHPRFEAIRHDIIHPIDLEIDAIYNLACPASPVHYQFDPVRTVQANVLGVTNMLELAKRTKARILQASTSEVYGDPKQHPQTEGYWGHVNPIGIRSCYDEGKRVAETLMMDYHRQYRIDIRIVRIFNTYGPRMAPDDGSFCYVSDMIDGLNRMMGKANFIGPVNLGNPEEFTVLALAEKVIALTGSRSKIVHKPLPQDDPIKRRPDITLAKEKLKWAPLIQIDEGLQKTISYFDKLLSEGK